MSSPTTMFGLCCSPKNTFEKHFSLNLQMPEDNYYFDQNSYLSTENSGSKARLVSEDHYFNTSSNMPWYHYEMPDGFGGACMMLVDPSFNDFNNLTDDL